MPFFVKQPDFENKQSLSHLSLSLSRGTYLPMQKRREVGTYGAIFVTYKDR